MERNYTLPFTLKSSSTKTLLKKGIEDALADIARNAKTGRCCIDFISAVMENNASSREVKKSFLFRPPLTLTGLLIPKRNTFAREQGIDAEYLNENIYQKSNPIRLS
jgi:hypothetical protein